jgi:hypothetical protein
MLHLVPERYGALSLASLAPISIFSHKTSFIKLTSDQARIPAELKHINKRRKRNQQGLP